MVARAAAKLTDLTLSQMRSYGTKTKIRPNQVKIGGTESGLYYDKDLPFLKTRVKTNDKGKTYTQYHFRRQVNEPSDMLTVQSWDPNKQKKVMVRVRRDDPRLNWYTHGSGWKSATLLQFGGQTKGEKIAKPLAEKIYNNPQKYGALDDKGNLSIHKVRELINAKFVDEGLKPYTTVAPVNNILKEIRGKIKFPIIGTPKETEIVNFLKKDDLYKTIPSTDVAKKFPDVPDYIINRIRQVKRPGFPKGLGRTNIGDTGSTSKVGLARRKLERMIKKKYGNLTDQQVEAVAEHGRTMLQSRRHTPVQPRYGMKYPDEDIQIAFNFLDDTFLKKMPREINEYAFERSLNELRRLLTGKKWTAGHSRRSPEDWWWFGGDEVAAINPQLSGLNLEQLKLDSAFQSAIRSGDIATAEKKMTEMMKKGMRSSMVDDYGELIFYGAPAKKGKMAEGGIVNGYAGGGLIKKLLGESLGMMSRRKFMKGMGATAISAALPKSALKLAAPAAKKAALSFAPPWVNGMLSALKDIPITAKTTFRMGNEALVHKIGSKKIKIWGHEGKVGTKSYFKIKPSDETMADDLITKDLGKGAKDDFSDLEAWDDITLTEEPGQTTITWPNRAYEGNDQHIVIDKLNKETRFVDDNWHMEAGGEDIAKDDWIEYSISPKDIKNAMTVPDTPLGGVKIPEGKITDSLIDYHSVNDMDNTYSGIFQSYVDSFTPSGNVFGTVERMRKMLNKPSITKKYKKEINKMQKTLDTHQENKMLDWEEQFRGGHGMHGYKSGGMSGPGRRKKLGKRSDQAIENSRMTRLRNMSDVEAMARMMHAESSQDIRDAQAIGHVIQNRASYKGPESTYGLHESRNLSPIKRVLAGQGQFTPFRSTDNLNFWDFDMTEDNDYYKYAKQIMLGQADDFTQGSTMFDLDPNKYAKGYNKYWNFNPSQFSPDEYGRMRPHEGPHSFWGITPRMNKGGMAEKFSVDDAVAMINAAPQNFAGGGIVKLFAPKVIGKLTKYATRARPSKARLYKPPKGPYTITDESGVRILDREFQTLGGAKIALDDLAKLRTQDASTFKIFGARKPKTAEGAWEPAPQVDLGMVGKKIKIAKGTKYGDPDKPGAIFWGSREKIIGSPQESMKGGQWLDYLLGKGPQKGFPIIKHAELNDTSLAPFLSKYKNKVIPKKTLVDSFDRIAPKMDVKVAGREVKTEMMNKYLNALRGIDPQEYREPQAGIFRYLKSTEDQLKRGMQPDAIAKHKEEAESIFSNINKIIYDNYGVANVLEQGFPQRFPFKFKNMINQLSSASGKRVTGLRAYSGEPQYAATQTLGGGDNPRELLFKYTPGAMRKGEPVYEYAHGFSGIPEAEGKNAFVHMRMTDRTDEYGRRILFIEEIQSDMHQPINAALRSVKRMVQEGTPPVPGTLKKSKYAPRGDIPLPVNLSDEANEMQFKLIKAKIDDLGAQRQTVETQKRLTKLNRERTKIRKILDASKKKAEPKTSGVPQGPYSKTEDYNEFVIKYATKMAQEGGYDGVSVASPAVKNRGLRPTDDSFGGNLVAYGPMMTGAMKKVAKKSGAKFLKTSIMDNKGVAWEVPIIWLDDQAKFVVSKGLPAYKRGGIARHG